MKVLVIGESAIDIFQYGTCSRLSPEAPVPVFVPSYKTENGGMAANVVANMKALNAELDIEFVTNTSKMFKVRYVDQRSNQHIMRQDINDRVEEKYRHVDYDSFQILVVSDYDKGFLSISDLVYMSKSVHLSFLDTKKPVGEWAKNFTFVKINESEYNNRICSLANMIVTKGDKGAVYDGKIYPAETPQVLMDVSGAGDSFLAGLVCNYIYTKDIDEAIIFANSCANKVIQKRGVSVI